MKITRGQQLMISYEKISALHILKALLQITKRQRGHNKQIL